MSKVLYAISAIWILLAAVAFTVSTLAEPTETAVEKLPEPTETGIGETDFATEEGAEIDFEGETEGEAGLDPPETSNGSEMPSETILETIAGMSEKPTEEPMPAAEYYEIPLSWELQELIFAECERYGLPPEIVIAVIEKESRFDTYALGDDGRAFGLMQIQPKWHLRRMIDMGCTNLFDPHQNVRVGIAILGELKYRRDDVGWALTAYNSGEGNADKGLNDYSLDVIKRAGELERMRCYNG